MCQLLSLFTDHLPVGRLQYDEVEGHEKFADDFQMAMTYYTKQSLMGGDVELQDAYDWRSAKARFDLPMPACVPPAAVLSLSSRVADSCAPRHAC